MSTYTFKRSGDLLGVAPAPSVDVLRFLQTIEHERQADGRIEASPRRLFQVYSNAASRDTGEASDDELVTLAGLEPVIVHALRSSGHDVNSRPWHPPKALTPVSERSPNSTERDLVEFVRAHDRALIRYEPGVDRGELIARAAADFPDAQIVVAMTRKRDARELGRFLRSRAFDVGVFTSPPHPAVAVRIAVGTYLSLGAAVPSLTHRHILFAYDGEEIFSASGRMVLAHADRAQNVALVPQDRRLAPHDEDLLRGFFGFSEILMPRLGHDLPQVAVQFHRIAGGPLVPNGLDPLAFRAAAIWQHPVRNRKIARLAQTLRDGSAVGDLVSPRIAVVVDAIEHAVALARRLPDWPIVTNEPLCTTEMIRNDKRLLKARIAKVVGDRCIISRSGLRHIGHAGFDVLIRADGGAGGLNSPDCPNARKFRPRLLVDFDDRHHPALRRWSRQRQQAYRELGWYEPGADPLLERIRGWMRRHAPC